MVVSVEALKKAHSLLERNTDTNDDLYLVYVLGYIIKNAESKESDTANLEDISSFKSYVLWDGPNDVDYILYNGGFHTNQLDALHSNIYWEIIRDISDKVDWKGIEEESERIGNEKIEEAISKYGKEHPELGLTDLSFKSGRFI